MKKIFTLLFMPLFFLAKSTILFAQAVNVGDSMALVDLYNSTNGPNWGRNENWLKGPVKTWVEIYLTPDGTRVQKIDLSFHNLDGEIPASLGNLTSCEYIYLFNNNLSGKIPESLGNLTSLKVLYLFLNRLSGSIPVSLGYLPNLFSLDLGSNLLSGKVPKAWEVCPSLLHLNLERNKFTFDGMEQLVQKNNPNYTYHSQDTVLPIGHNDNVLFVSAGGTLKNNTYTWQNTIGADTTIKGDSTFTPRTTGYYTAVVRNSIATGFYLYSNQLFASPISIIDPNPGHDNPKWFISTNLSNIDYTKTVTKAATDGLTKLLLVSHSSTPITFTIDGNNNGVLSSLANQSLSSKQITISPDASGRIVAIYTVPDGYGTSSPAGGQTCSIKINSTNNINNNTTVAIKLVTPPVVLVHGMWSDPSVWEKAVLPQH